MMSGIRMSYPQEYRRIPYAPSASHCQQQSFRVKLFEFLCLRHQIYRDFLEAV